MKIDGEIHKGTVKRKILLSDNDLKKLSLYGRIETDEIIIEKY